MNPDPAEPQRRRRRADQIANQLYTAKLLGGTVRLVQRHPATLTLHPLLRDILTAAPQIAATGDPTEIRVARTSTAAVAVIRVHGPSWSVILSSGRPMPDWLLAVHDAYPVHLLPPPRARPGHLHALDLRADLAAQSELTRMCRLIHAALPAGPR